MIHFSIPKQKEANASFGTSYLVNARCQYIFTCIVPAECVCLPT